MIQIDMPMPDSCYECRFETARGFCKAMPDNFCGYTNDEGRPEWCPLKEQEHSETFIVIDNKTGKEAYTYNIALHEDWAKHLCYCDMEGWAIEEDGTLLLVDECGRFAYADRERFKVVWDV